MRAFRQLPSNTPAASSVCVAPPPATAAAGLFCYWSPPGAGGLCRKVGQSSHLVASSALGMLAQASHAMNACISVLAVLAAPATTSVSPLSRSAGQTPCLSCASFLDSTTCPICPPAVPQGQSVLRTLWRGAQPLLLQPHHMPEAQQPRHRHLHVVTCHAAAPPGEAREAPAAHAMPAQHAASCVLASAPNNPLQFVPAPGPNASATTPLASPCTSRMLPLGSDGSNCTVSTCMFVSITLRPDLPAPASRFRAPIPSLSLTLPSHPTIFYCCTVESTNEW